MTPTPPATANPAPTAAASASLTVNDVPDGDLVDAGPTAVCDPPPNQADEAAGVATIACGDGLTLGLRAFQAVTDAGPDRLYLRRPPCTGTPCSDEVLNTVDVFGWFGERVYGVRWDWRSPTIAMPALVDEDPWPDPGASDGPAPGRPTLKGATSEIEDRTPLPYCGRAELRQPASVSGCFRDAVLDARPAEMIDVSFGTEGGRIVGLYRFDGTGPIHAYERAGGAWSMADGMMAVGITPDAWDFVPFPARGERP